MHPALTTPLPYTRTLWADTETRSVNGITAGAYVYAEAPSECLLFIYALDDGLVQIWDRACGEPMPLDLHTYLSAPDVELAFHNAEFDRTNMLVWDWCKGYDLNPWRFRCTMTQARMCGLPGALGDLCKALGLPDTVSKKDGNALIRTFCIPQANGHFIQPEQQPEQWIKFRDYARDDVVAMRECMRSIPNLYDGPERSLYAYTTIMNDRGIPIDRELATVAATHSEAIKRGYKRQGARLAAGFKVGDDEREFSITSQVAVLAFMKSYGVTLEDARAATIEKFLDSAQGSLIPDHVRQLLNTRLRASKAATTKYTAMLKGANRDDRIRGTINFYGAQRTGRDAGRRVQTQNLSRPVMVGVEGDWKKGFEGLDMDKAVHIVKSGLAEFYFDQPLQLMSDTVRGTICATAGHKFCGADLSNIEGRGLVWLTQEQWKLDYFRQFDAKQIRFDNYIVAYAKAFNVDPSEVTKGQRQLGKTLELACGYSGSIGAFITFAAIYRIDLDSMGEGVRASAETALWGECASQFDWYKDHDMTYGLSEQTFTACLYLVKAWRLAHPMTVRRWAEAEEAFRNAIRNPGIRFQMAHNTFATNVNGWVFVTLPSGRNLVYPHAFEEESSKGKNSQLCFWGTNPFNRKYSVNRTYSGRLIENITQAFARDVLLYRVPDVEAAGYGIVMRVHDELLTEVPDRPEFSGDHLAAMMATPHAWCADMPLAAVGEDLYRYQK